MEPDKQTISDDYQSVLIEKTKAETADIEKRINAPWYKGRFFIEVLVGSLITSGLLAAWFISYLSPILSAKSELALIKAEIAQNEANFQQKINRDRTDDLNSSVNVLTEKLNKTLELNRKIQTQQDVLEDRLKKERLEYSNLKKTFEKEAKSLEKESEKYANLVALSVEAGAKLKNLQLEINDIRKDRKEALVSEGVLENILTIASLNGLWRGSGKIAGRSVYIEFLPKGKIRTYAGIDGEEFVFGNQKWHIENNSIVLITEQDGKKLKSIGKLESGRIVGTQDLPGGSSTKWILTRAR